MKPAAPMHRLMLLRHGHAVRSQPGESDFDRRLEPRGGSEAAQLGAFLARHRISPELALISPAVRAQETWARVASALPTAPAAKLDSRLYDARTEGLFNLIREATEAQSLLLVGHNPGLHDLAMLLIATGDVETRERMREGLPPAGLVVIDFAIGSWAKLHPQSGRLELFVEPDTLATAVD